MERQPDIPVLTRAQEAAVFLEDTDGEEDVKIWFTIPDHLSSSAQQRGACWDADTQRWYAPSDEVAAALHELLRAPATSTPTADSAPAGAPVAPTPQVANTSEADARVYYDVPFSQKDEVKVLGCRWDKERRSWFAPNAEVAAAMDASGRWPRKDLPAQGGGAGSQPQEGQVVQVGRKRKSNSQDDQRVFYSVPFSEKDDIKALGCFYEKPNGWYAPSAAVAAAVDATGRWKRVDCSTPVHLVGEDRSFGGGLFVDLIPATSWCKNARALIHKDDWDRVRMHVYDRVQGRCEACGVDAVAAGSRLECHERWEYRPPVQKLVRLVALCHACHQATHMGFAEVSGRGDQAMAHLRKVTGMSSAEAQVHASKAFQVWKQLSLESWSIDCSLLTRSGIKVNDRAWSSSGR